MSWNPSAENEHHKYGNNHAINGTEQEVHCRSFEPLFTDRVGC